MIRIRYFPHKWSRKRFQVADNDRQMLPCKVTLKLGHSYHIITTKRTIIKGGFLGENPSLGLPFFPVQLNWLEHTTCWYSVMVARRMPLVIWGGVSSILTIGTNNREVLCSIHRAGTREDTHSNLLYKSILVHWQDAILQKLNSGSDSHIYFLGVLNEKRIYFLFTKIK